MFHYKPTPRSLNFNDEILIFLEICIHFKVSMMISLSLLANSCSYVQENDEPCRLLLSRPFGLREVLRYIFLKIRFAN